ncbi:hypothetical protein ACTMU2_18555 [Cupriavidus basilensis]
MALNFLSKEPSSAAGIDFSAKQVLRLGVPCWDCASRPRR